MKKLILLIPVFALAFWGCDYVSEPHQAGANQGGPGGNGVTRRILLEEATGHVCTNCPQGAATIASIEGLYGDKVIPISIHCGSFADPCPPNILPAGAPTGSYTEDFTTPEGAEFEATFGDLPIAEPSGMINRKGYPGNYRVERADWTSVADSLVAVAPVADLEFDTIIYNSSTRSLNFSITGKFIAAQNGTFKLTVMILEDSLTGWQLDNGVNVQNFVFMHVLRGCVNTPGSIFGTQVAAGTIAENSTFNYTLPSAYTVNSNWVANHCKLVAYVYNSSTMEVLQAVEKDL